MQGKGAAGVVLGLDAERFECRLEQGEHPLALLGLEDAGRDVERLISRLAEGLDQGAGREPAEMGAIEQTALLVAPLALEETEDEAPVLDIGHRGEDHPLWGEERPRAGQKAPRIAQVLKHVAQNQAIDAAFEIGGEGIVLDIAAEDPVEAGGGELGAAAVDLDPDHLRLRIAPLEGRPERPRPAAHVKDEPGAKGDPLQEIGVEPVGVNVPGHAHERLIGCGS